MMSVQFSVFNSTYFGYVMFLYMSINLIDTFKIYIFYEFLHYNICFSVLSLQKKNCIK